MKALKDARFNVLIKKLENRPALLGVALASALTVYNDGTTNQLDAIMGHLPLRVQRLLKDALLHKWSEDENRLVKANFKERAVNERLAKLAELYAHIRPATVTELNSVGLSTEAKALKAGGQPTVGYISLGKAFPQKTKAEVEKPRSKKIALLEARLAKLLADASDLDCRVKRDDKTGKIILVDKTKESRAVSAEDADNAELSVLLNA